MTPATSTPAPGLITPTSVSRICAACRKPYPYNQPHECQEAGGTGQSAPDDPLIGAIIADRYHIDSFLQGGGMGLVYKARHEVLGHLLAVKVLTVIPDGAAQQRFLLEAKAACSIGHLNIVHVVDFGMLPDRRPYLVMEYLQGQGLDGLITQAGEGGVPPLRACRIAEQIALGIQAVHDKGIVHRDLKPGNIYVLDMDGKDFVKILDFGIAKVVAGSSDDPRAPARITLDGTVVGTPEYMAPESATGQTQDHRVDQYALGCILYEMLIGKLPFEVPGNPTATLLKHITDRLVPMRERRPDLFISASLDQLVCRALAKDAADRFPNMRALALALKREADLLIVVDEQATHSYLPVPLPSVIPAPVAEPGKPILKTAVVTPVQTTPVPVTSSPTTQPSLAIGPGERRWLRPAVLGGLVAAAMLVIFARSEKTPPALKPPTTAAVQVPVRPAAVVSAPVKPAAVVFSPARPAVISPMSRRVAPEAPPPAADAVLKTAREHALRMTLESGNAVAINLACPGVAPATIPPKGIYHLVIPSRKKGTCVLSAKGYEVQMLPYQILRTRFKGDSGAMPIRLPAL